MRGPQRIAGGRERREAQGTWAGPERKRHGLPEGTRIFLIYSNEFQTSLNCFDQKIYLPSSKNFK
jgi:hypothetical protein